MQVPAQRRGLHATLISLETSSDVPAIHFLILTCRYGKGLGREPQNMFFFQSILQNNLWISDSVTRRKAFLGFHSQMSFPDVIELTRKTNMLDGPVRTPYDIRSFKCVRVLCIFFCTVNHRQSE